MLHLIYDNKKNILIEKISNKKYSIIKRFETTPEIITFRKSNNSLEFVFRDSSIEIVKDIKKFYVVDNMTILSPITQNFKSASFWPSMKYWSLRGANINQQHFKCGVGSVDCINVP